MEAVTDEAEEMREERGAETDAGAPSPPKRRGSDRNGRKLEPQIGRALRSVYDDTVGEQIPPEMLDLLDKLS